MAATRDCAVIFVDLAGYTALTEAHGDQQAVEEASALKAGIEAVMPPGGRLVKTMGDGAFLTTASAVDALALVRNLATELDGSCALPLRAGLHFGPVLESDGDIFGGTVNLAARLVGLADASQAVGTSAIAEGARQAGFHVVSLGLRDLRNLSETVEVFDLGIISAGVESRIDPVCRMPVNEAHAAGELRFGEHVYWFCSLDCVQRFSAHPERFTACSC